MGIYGTCDNGNFKGMKYANYASMFESDCHRYVHKRSQKAPVSTSTHTVFVLFPHGIVLGSVPLSQNMVLPTATLETPPVIDDVPPM